GYVATVSTSFDVASRWGCGAQLLLVRRTVAVSVGVSVERANGYRADALPVRVLLAVPTNSRSFIAITARAGSNALDALAAPIDLTVTVVIVTLYAGVLD